ncbi:Di-copper centre-containing domain superfamily protein [Pleurotus pulmonarius]
MRFPQLQAILSIIYTVFQGPQLVPETLSELQPQPSTTRCTSPTVRKEWRSLTKMERTDWITAVKCLHSLPHDSDYEPPRRMHLYMPPLNTSSSYYDDLVYFHVNNDNYVHLTGLFFPWHRWLLHNVELALKAKCNYDGPTPYWDWVQDSLDFHGSTMFQDPDPQSGLGGWGASAADDYTITDGAFSANASFIMAYPVLHSIRRHFDLYPYLKSLQPELIPNPSMPGNMSITPSLIRGIIGGHVGDFKGFQAAFEGFQGPHSAVHLMVGGDLAGTCPPNAPEECKDGSKWAPNDPLFWMHHAMIDKVWSEWQSKHEANFMSFEGGSVQRFENITIHERYPNGGPPFLHLDSALSGHGLFPDGRIADVMNTTGGYLCYVYE